MVLPGIIAADLLAQVFGEPIHAVTADRIVFGQREGEVRLHPAPFDPQPIIDR